MKIHTEMHVNANPNADKEAAINNFRQSDHNTQQWDRRRVVARA